MREKIKENITEILLALLLICTIIIFTTGCSSSLYKYREHFDENKPVVTHVFALTNQGDTIKIPINDIHPQRLYNVIGYDFYNPYDMYYNRYRNNWYDRYYDYRRNYGHYQGVQSSGFGIQYNNISPTQSSSSGIVSGSGTSGFSGNPVASNPVTSGGGVKKNN